MRGLLKFLKHWVKKLPYIRSLADQIRTLHLDVDRLEAERNLLQTHIEQVLTDRNLIADNRDRLGAEAERLAAAVRQIESERTALYGGFVELQAQLEQARADLNQYRTWTPPGHFYSPVVSIDEIRMREKQIFGSDSRTVTGIDLREQDQLELLKKLGRNYPDMDFPARQATSHRFYFENPNYGYADAILYYLMIRHLKPKRIVEIGSGFSSCVALDTNDRYFKGSIQCTFVEPYPHVLQSLLTPGDEDRINLIPASVHEVDESTFLALEENDILFIDSTHVSKTNSDVNHLLFKVLPALNRGVNVHFHDIFFPFEYPKEWIYEGRSWNECYALKAFLYGYGGFTVELFADFLARFHNESLRKYAPLCLRLPGSSIWLKKVVDSDPAAIKELRQRPYSELPGRVDLVKLTHPKQLGSGWHEKEYSKRFMQKCAEVRLKGPASTTQRLWVEATNENSRAFALIARADGIPLGTAPVDKTGPVRADFPLPDAIAGREVVVIALEVTETFSLRGDDRKLGLAFGVIEIR